jgi:hypothetical protein
MYLILRCPQPTGFGLSLAAWALRLLAHSARVPLERGSRLRLSSSARGLSVGHRPGLDHPGDRDAVAPGGMWLLLAG